MLNPDGLSLSRFCMIFEYTVPPPAIIFFFSFGKGAKGYGEERGEGAF